MEPVVDNPRDMPLKDTANTDVVAAGDRLLALWYLAGAPYAVDPLTLETLGAEDFDGTLRCDMSAHAKVDTHTDELMFFDYGPTPPYMRYGVVGPQGRVTHLVDVDLPGPRLPHDMAFTENYAILNDFPLFWDPQLLEHDVHLPRFYPDIPSRFAVIPRRGGTGDIRWFEADPTFVLHFTNAYEDGDEIVLDGFFEGDPSPLDTGGTKWEKLFRFLALDRLQARLHRWRFNLVTGAVREERLSESITEFGTINPECAGGDYRYTYAATGRPGWFLFDGLVKHDLRTGTEEGFSFGEGVYGSETAMAPRVGATGEDDGYLVTLTTDMNTDASYCLVFDAARVGDGPVCKLQLPERISSGTHSTWAPGAQLRRWDTADSAAAAIGL
jgi:carotenoid cleavage dioxygenase